MLVDNPVIDPVVPFSTMRTIVWVNFYGFLVAGIILALLSFVFYKKYWNPQVVFKSVQSPVEEVGVGAVE